MCICNYICCMNGVNASTNDMKNVDPNTMTASTFADMQHTLHARLGMLFYEQISIWTAMLSVCHTQSEWRSFRKQCHTLFDKQVVLLWVKHSFLLTTMLMQQSVFQLEYGIEQTLNTKMKRDIWKYVGHNKQIYSLKCNLAKYNDTFT